MSQIIKNIQTHSVSSSFTPWHQGCICFEEESCHSRWTMREQKDSRAMSRNTFFYLSHRYTYHKCLTFGSHDVDSCKLQSSSGSREAAWIRRMNTAELTSSLTHLPLWMPQSAAGQEPRGKYLQTLAFLQLLSWSQIRLVWFCWVWGFFPFVFKREKAGQWQGQKSSKAGVIIVCQRKVHSVFWQQGLVFSVRN